MRFCNEYLDPKTISNEKLVNSKIVDLIVLYNFHINIIFIRLYMEKLDIYKFSF